MNIAALESGKSDTKRISTRNIDTASSLLPFSSSDACCEALELTLLESEKDYRSINLTVSAQILRNRFFAQILFEFIAAIRESLNSLVWWNETDTKKNSTCDSHKHTAWIGKPWSDLAIKWG